MPTTPSIVAPPTKFSPPRLRFQSVERHRLGYPDSPSPGLHLVVAPPGSGKTTLLAQWYRTVLGRGDTAAWLSLDQFDDSPSRFFALLAQALREIVPAFSAEATSRLAVDPGWPPVDAMTSLIADLSGLNQTFLLILDDFHEVPHPGIREAIDFLLTYLPPTTSIAIGSRHRPNLKQARLKLRGEVIEVTPADLRFNAEEAAAFLAIDNLRPSEDILGNLLRQTEGWICGLQLASFALRHPEANASDLMADFKGDGPAVTQYLLQEAFLGLDESLRAFMLDCSILDQLSAAICDAVTGRGDAAIHLQEMERANLFLTWLDDGWARLHPLFAGFLRARLTVLAPARVPLLHGRAAAWLANHGFARPALHHALVSGDLEVATAIVRDEGATLFRESRFRELADLVESLPDRTVRLDPTLCCLHAWALAYLGQLDRADERLRLGEDLAEGGTGGAAIRAELALTRTALGVIRNDVPDVSRLTPDIERHFPQEEAATQGIAHIMQAYAARAKGELASARRHCEAAVNITETTPAALVNLLARFLLGGLLLLEGRATEAEAGLRDSMAASGSRRWDHSLGSAYLRGQFGAVLTEVDRLDEALAVLDEAVTMLKECGGYGFLGVALTSRARVRKLLCMPEAVEDLAEAEAIGKRSRQGRVVFRATLVAAEWALADCDPGLAQQKLTRLRDIGSNAPDSEQGETLAALGAAVARMGGSPEAGLRLLEPALASARAAGRNFILVKLLTEQAAALQAVKDETGAMQARRAAETICRNGGLALLLRNTLGITSGGVLTRTSLHVRETQILRLLDQGLRNGQIAQRLQVSEQTVKWYLKGLFQKLDVGTRTQAVAVARKQGLVQ